MVHAAFSFRLIIVVHTLLHFSDIMSVSDVYTIKFFQSNTVQYVLHGTGRLLLLYVSSLGRVFVFVS
jgi:hypothetical protein